MSFVVDVCVWLGDDNQIDQISRFGHLLESVPIPKHREYDGSEVKRFTRLRVYAGQSSNVVLDEYVNTNDVSPVLEILKPYTEKTVRYEVDSVFDYLRYSDSINQVEPTVGPLKIDFYGSQYEWEGHYYKRFGPMRLSFFNTKVFRVPEVLINQVRKAASERADCAAALQMISKLSHNFDIVEDLTKELIRKLDPLHILICTEAEIHPLTAHAIYHQNWEDYLGDLTKIAKLHECGGNYFCEVNSDEPAFAEPRKSSPNYGYIRRWNDTEEELVERLQPMIDAILESPERIQSAPRIQIEECFDSLEDTEIEKINNSYYISSEDGPFGYLEEPYFMLYTTVYRAKEPESSDYEM
jgi:hypothetical protein